MKLSDDELQELAICSAELPDGPWECWTSNSFRRITGPDGRDGGVLSGIKQRSDGHPDLSMRESEVYALCKMVNLVRGILDRCEQ